MAAGRQFDFLCLVPKAGGWPAFNMVALLSTEWTGVTQDWCSETSVLCVASCYWSTYRLLHLAPPEPDVTGRRPPVSMIALWVTWRPFTQGFTEMED